MTDPVAADPRIGSELAGYRLEAVIGRGGMGVVYRAEQISLKRNVALKLLLPGFAADDRFRERFLRESELAASLDHPNIIPIYDAGEADGMLYLAMRYVEGSDLKTLLHEQGRLEVARVLRILEPVGDALDAAHARGLVHRDVKPANILLAEGQGGAEHVYLSDFGLTTRAEGQRDLTESHELLGTFDYVAPEQIESQELDGRADLYSLGCVFYECLTGEVPFRGESRFGVLISHLQKPPPKPSMRRPGLPSALDEIVSVSMAKEPGHRYSSCSEFLSGARTALAFAQGDTRQQAAPEALVRGGELPFVGRERELGELHAALETSLSVRGQLVLLVGEAGIGKTRTTLELARYAEVRRVGVLSGRCHEAGGAPPYWPWVQAIRSYVRECDLDRLRAALGADSVEIARLIPDVRERLPGLGQPSAVQDPKQARFRLFDSFAGFLNRAAASQPLMIVLDDLHWADRDSLLLLEFIAHELAGMRLLLVGTYREHELARGHALYAVLAELSREHLAERIVLEGLSPADVGRYIEATSGIVSPTQLAEAVHTQTEGNPLFVTEVVRLLAQEGELMPERLGTSSEIRIGIPAEVRDVIRRRLDRLSEPCNDALTVAAVIGREFGFTELRRLIEELTGERLLELLEEALAARVIEELPEALDRYQFTHALFQEVIEGALSKSRLVRLHAQIAQTLEDLYGDEAEAHASELAHHYAEAAALLGPEKLVRYSLLAGERALAAHAYEKAIAQYERALAGTEQQPMDDAIAALRFGLGRAQLAVLEENELGRAVGNLKRSFDYYLNLGELDRAIEVAAHPVPPGWTLSQTEFPSMVGRALDFVSKDSLEEGRLLATHAWFVGAADADYEAGRSAIDRSLRIATRSGDAALERSALANAAYLERAHMRVDACLEASSKLAELAAQANDDGARLVAEVSMSREFTVRGDTQEAHSHAAAALEAAERLRGGWWLASARSGLLALSALQGDWSDARRLSDLALASQANEPRLLALRALVEYQVGEFQRGAGYVDRVVEIVERSPDHDPFSDPIAAAFIPLLGRISGQEDHYDRAEALVDELLSGREVMPYWQVHAQTGLAFLAVERQQAKIAERAYAMLAPQSGTAVPLTYVAADRLLGLLAEALGRSEAAAAHFEDALAFCHRADYLPEYAWTAYEYADALLARRSSEDHAKARVLQDESLSIARELAMTPLIERVLAHQKISNA